MLDVKYLKSVVEAGEAIGVIAGQSIGEPSTQMTLNTFHLAGHSAKNVTLGIPRLRELVMTASSNISTPTMTLILNPELSADDAKRFAKGITTLALADITDKVVVCERFGPGTGHSQAKIYDVKLYFYPADEYCRDYSISINDVQQAIRWKFMRHLRKGIKMILRKKSKEKSLAAAAESDALPELGKAAGGIEMARSGTEREQDEDNNAVGREEEEEETGTAGEVAQRTECVSYDEPEVDEQETGSDQGIEVTANHDNDSAYGGSPPPTEEMGVKSLEASVKELYDEVTTFFFSKAGDFCEFTLEYPASLVKFLMLPLIESALKISNVQHIPGLSVCIASTENIKNSETGDIASRPAVVTKGVNLLAMRQYQHIIDPHLLRTNDIHAMLELYGVEACRALIVREVGEVFISHGISVDARHIGLMADMMTRKGGFSAFSRIGLSSSISPFMKMSFETTVRFLNDAVLERDWDDLRNPSAKIVTGNLSHVGTGSFDLLMPLQ